MPGTFLARPSAAQWPLIDSPNSAPIRFPVSLIATAIQETLDVPGFLVPEINPMNVRITSVSTTIISKPEVRSVIARLDLTAWETLKVLNQEIGSGTH